MQKIYLEKIPIPKEIPKILELIDELLTKSNCKQIDEIEDEIDSIIFAAIQLSIEEINFIRLTLQ